MFCILRALGPGGVQAARQHRRAALHGAAAALALCLLITLGVARSDLAAQTTWSADRASYTDLSRTKNDANTARRDYTENVQVHLDRMGCYDERVGNIDGDFGTESRAALDRLTARAGSFPASARRNALAFQTYLAGLPDGYCRGAAGTGRGARTCYKDDVGRDFLSQLPVEYRRAQGAQRPMQFLHDNFDRIFKDGVLSRREVTSDKAIERLGVYGERGIDRDTTRNALKTALDYFKSLSFKYGFKDGGACQVCYMVNNWRYLSNFAQSTGGILFHSDPRISIAVNELNTTMMFGVQDNLLIHRRMTAKWLSLVASKKSEYTILDDITGEPKAVISRGELEEKRRIEMDYLIEQALDIRDGVVKIDPGAAPSLLNAGRLMKDLVQGSERYDCVGFDGSTID